MVTGKISLKEPRNKAMSGECQVSPPKQESHTFKAFKWTWTLPVMVQNFNSKWVSHGSDSSQNPSPLLWSEPLQSTLPHHMAQISHLATLCFREWLEIQLLTEKISFLLSPKHGRGFFDVVGFNNKRWLWCFICKSTEHKKILWHDLVIAACAFNRLQHQGH